MKHRTSLSRRSFLRGTLPVAGALAFPQILPAATLGRGGHTAPNDRLGVAVIGSGDRAQDVMNGFLAQSSCRVVALADVKQDMLAAAHAKVAARYPNPACGCFQDFREMLEQPGIDAVLIGSPDHWHVLHAMAAVRAGKDVYVEKPLGYTLGESLALQRQAQRRQRIFQFGTQQRSDRKFRQACEWVRNGCVGELRHINVWAPGSTPGGSTRPVPAPPSLNYDRWLGPAPWREHTENLAVSGAAKTWWFNSAYAVGFIAGWGIHPIDIALWGAGARAEGTFEVEGTGNFPREGACDTATTWDLNFRFASGLTMRFVGVPNGSDAERFEQEAEWKSRYRGLTSHGTAFEGEAGWVRVDRGSVEVQPESVRELADDRLGVQLPRSEDHVRNFLESVRARRPAICPIEDAVRADALCHVADIAIRLRRRLVFDQAKMRFRDDAEANARLAVRAMRKPWHL
ncbi:MAG: Gfo/Idh/MocA family oxidoreductase [Verrucomicrobiales bacterium]|nr:Gfo/Idh/MocA family oxidoreductase [Verrucomicrobiales bacterium]